MEEFAEKSLLLAFRYHGHQVQLRASARGWAKQKALDQGMIAINSVLRDWVKGQLTAIETGIMPFRLVFLPYMLTASGETVGELVDHRGGQILELPE